jgi:hypothetical protein
MVMGGMHRMRALRSVVPPSVRRLGSRAVSGADQLSRVAFTAPPLTADQVDRMAVHFLPDLARLEDLLGSGLETWRAPSASGDEARELEP